MNTGCEALLPTLNTGSQWSNIVQVRSQNYLGKENNVRVSWLNSCSDFEASQEQYSIVVCRHGRMSLSSQATVHIPAIALSPCQVIILILVLTLALIQTFIHTTPHLYLHPDPTHLYWSPSPRNSPLAIITAFRHNQSPNFPKFPQILPCELSSVVNSVTLLHSQPANQT
jgi:hypothetical protein